jgi:hypothetical protein
MRQRFSLRKTLFLLLILNLKKCREEINSHNYYLEGKNYQPYANNISLTKVTYHCFLLCIVGTLNRQKNDKIKYDTIIAVYQLGFNCFIVPSTRTSTCIVQKLWKIIINSYPTLIGTTANCKNVVPQKNKKTSVFKFFLKKLAPFKKKQKTSVFKNFFQKNLTPFKKKQKTSVFKKFF